MMPKEIFLDVGVEEVRTSSIIGTSVNSSSFSNPQRKRKRRSEIWNHFIKVNQNKGARCHYCSHILSFAAGSLSNLLRHLRKKHPSIAANFRYGDSKAVVKIIKEEDSYGERFGTGEEEEERLNEKDMSYREEDCGSKQGLSGIDIESHFRRDHSYGERPPWKKDQIFGQFVQSELNKFKNELLMRQCKREILQVLIKFQESEDELYCSPDSPSAQVA